MNRVKRLLLGVAAAGVLCSVGTADAQTHSWDTFSDTWAVTDALGRRAPGFEEVGGPRKDRFVGIFYFLWLGGFPGDGPYDVTQILQKDPTAMSNPASQLWGPLYAPHHWGESRFGYYRVDDEYVLRKHAQMLSDAGVDVMIFDVSNNVTYKPLYMKLLEVFTKIRAEGGRTPQVAFLCPFGDPAKVVRELYADLYGPGLYKDLWFRWKGKPLILADPSKIGGGDAKTIGGFFTFRAPQPSYFEGPANPDMWSWLEVYPQHVFQSADGRKEQMSIGVAQNAVGNRLGSMSEIGARGRNWHDGANDESPGAIDRGYNFQEQAERVLQEGPDFVFITGWNEWVAGRFAEFNGIKLPVMFVDEYDEEFSRDIEPMKGGHGDDYYYQMVSFIRRYKGVRPAPVGGPPKTINMSGAFDQWRDVRPEFRDDRDDAAHRDHAGWSGATRYVNDTGRNDLVLMKVSRDRDFLYFYAQTSSPITPYTDPHWMMLFLNVGYGPAWEGYQFVVNRTPADAATCALEQSTGGWNWTPLARVQYRVSGNEIQIAIPRALLGFANAASPVRIEFKWVDNMQHEGDITDFDLYGDAAPNGRFNYIYEEGRR